MSGPGGLIPGTGSVAEACTMGFTVSVFASLLSRTTLGRRRESAFHRAFSNPRLAGAIVLALVLQVLDVNLTI